MESNKTNISRNLTEKKMDIDRAYVKNTQEQYNKKNPPMEPTRTKEESGPGTHGEEEWSRR